MLSRTDGHEGDVASRSGWGSQLLQVVDRQDRKTGGCEVGKNWKLKSAAQPKQDVCDGGAAGGSASSLDRR